MAFRYIDQSSGQASTSTKRDQQISPVDTAGSSARQKKTKKTKRESRPTGTLPGIGHKWRVSWQSKPAQLSHMHLEDAGFICRSTRLNFNPTTPETMGSTNGRSLSSSPHAQAPAYGYGLYFTRILMQLFALGIIFFTSAAPAKAQTPTPPPPSALTIEFEFIRPMRVDAILFRESTTKPG